ncbi:hypothetical protein ACJMK2_012635 [Sinanodonta woodiana]|uniref:Uncharacterized protein n=1 Tax=Sinanodonta woodiana TaxID=1069815 RepID=A0ABD3V8V3_SINWO
MHAFFPENEDFHEDDGLYEGIGIAMDEFVQMAIQTDDNEQCRAPLTDDDIVAAIKKNDDFDEDGIDDDESETPPLPCGSCREAFSMCDGLTRFLAQSASLVLSEEVHTHLDKLQRLLQREQLARQADEACMKLQSSVLTCANI